MHGVLDRNTAMEKQIGKLKQKEEKMKDKFYALKDLTTRLQIQLKSQNDNLRKSGQGQQILQSQ